MKLKNISYSKKSHLRGRKRNSEQSKIQLKKSTIPQLKLQINQPAGRKWWKTAYSLFKKYKKDYLHKKTVEKKDAQLNTTLYDIVDNIERDGTENYMQNSYCTINQCCFYLSDINSTTKSPLHLDFLLHMLGLKKQKVFDFQRGLHRWIKPHLHSILNFFWQEMELKKKNWKWIRQEDKYCNLFIFYFIFLESFAGLSFLSCDL